MQVGDTVHGLQERINGRGHYVDEPFVGVVRQLDGQVPMVAIGQCIVPLAQRSARNVWYCRVAGNRDGHWFAIHAAFGDEAACDFVEMQPHSILGHPVATDGSGSVWLVEVWRNCEVRVVRVRVSTITTYEAVR